MKIASEVELQLLAILSAHGELSGRAIAKKFKEESRRTLSYGTLYTTLRRMKQEGWVKSRDDKDEDGRICFFELDFPGMGALRRARAHYAALASFGEAAANQI
jgi:hypothetical protein